MGRALHKQCLSHWIVGAIALVKVLSPAGLLAHSTREMAAPWALFKGIFIQDICAAASWASSHTFAKFNRLHVTAPTLAHTVLGVGSSEGQGPFCVMIHTGQSVVRISLSGNTGVRIDHK